MSDLWSHQVRCGPIPGVCLLDRRLSLQRVYCLTPGARCTYSPEPSLGLWKPGSRNPKPSQPFGSHHIKPHHVTYTFMHTLCTVCNVCNVCHVCPVRNVIWCDWCKFSYIYAMYCNALQCNYSACPIGPQVRRLHSIFCRLALCIYFHRWAQRLLSKWVVLQAYAAYVLFLQEAIFLSERFRKYCMLLRRYLSLVPCD